MRKLDYQAINQYMNDIMKASKWFIKHINLQLNLMSSSPVILKPSPSWLFSSWIGSSFSVMLITCGLISLSIDIFSKFESCLGTSPPIATPADEDGETDDALEEGLVEILSKYDYCWPFRCWDTLPLSFLRSNASKLSVFILVFNWAWSLVTTPANSY